MGEPATFMRPTATSQAIAELTIENERLRERIAELEAERRLEDRAEFENKVHRRWALTQKESAVLQHLYERRSSVASKEAIYTSVYSTSWDDGPEMKIVDVFICKIRAKMGDGLIETVWGRGYMLTPAGVIEVEAALALPLLAVKPAQDTPRASKRMDAYLRCLDALGAIGRPASAREVAVLSDVSSGIHVHIARLRKMGLVERVGYLPEHERVNGRAAGLYALTKAGLRRWKARNS